MESEMLTLSYLLKHQLKIKQNKSEEKRIKHYKSSQKILLVGEGDFSFALCLATAFGDASNLFATSLDSRDELVRKYGDAKGNLEVLKEKDCIILHQVNAHTLGKHSVLRNHQFDRIVFNFPHARVWVGPEHNYLQIEHHQEVVRGFLNTTNEMLSLFGEIHITHKTAHPFNQWKITELAEEAGLELTDEVSFDKWDYPGYCNKKGEGHGLRCDDSFPVGACSTYMFQAPIFCSEPEHSDTAADGLDLVKEFRIIVFFRRGVHIVKMSRSHTIHMRPIWDIP